MPAFPRSRLLGVIAASVVLSSLVGFPGCDDGGTGPSNGTFALEIEVVDSSGDPVEGLDVVVWNMSSSLRAALQESGMPRRARTTIEFQLPSLSVCDLTVFDLDGNVVQRIHEARPLAPGRHQVSAIVGTALEAGVEILRYELVARAPSDGQVRFRESKYMTVVHLDRTRLLVGRTDADGRWSTQNRTFVPGLYDLPEMPIIDIDGDIRGTFSLGDSVVVRVYDDTGAWMRHEAAVRDRVNAMRMTWDPEQASRGPASTPGPGSRGRPEETRDTPGDESSGYVLEQNRPNPFN